MTKTNSRQEIVTPVLPLDSSPKIFKKVRPDGTIEFVDNHGSLVPIYEQKLTDYLDCLASEFEEVFQLFDDDTQGRYGFLFKLLIKRLKTHSEMIYQIFRKRDVGISLVQVLRGMYEDDIVTLSVKNIDNFKG